MRQVYLDLIRDCAEFIKPLEGFRVKKYCDVAGIPTIGYGSTGNIPDAISASEAELLLYSDVTRILAQYKMTSLIDYLERNQIIALVSLAYNVGFSNVRKSNIFKWLDKIYDEKIKMPFPYAESTVTNQYLSMVNSSLLSFTKCKGKEVRGLVNRRNKESNLFLTSSDYPFESVL